MVETPVDWLSTVTGTDVVPSVAVVAVAPTDPSLTDIWMYTFSPLGTDRFNWTLLLSPEVDPLIDPELDFVEGFVELFGLLLDVEEETFLFELPVDFLAEDPEEFRLEDPDPELRFEDDPLLVLEELEDFGWEDADFLVEEVDVFGFDAVGDVAVKANAGVAATLRAITADIAVAAIRVTV